MFKGIEYSIEKLKYLFLRTLYEWMKVVNPLSSCVLEMAQDSLRKRYGQCLGSQKKLTLYLD